MVSALRKLSVWGEDNAVAMTSWAMCYARPGLWGRRMVSLLGKLCYRHLTPANSLSPSMVRQKADGYSEEKDVKPCPRDSGYDSLSNRLSILDRLLHTHPIWLQLSLSEEEAAQVLQSQPPGVRLRTTGRQVEAGRAAASSKRKTWSSRKFSQPVQSVVPGVSLGCNAGKFWTVPRQLSKEKSPSGFVFLSSSAWLPWEVQDSEDNRASGSEEGLLPKGPGPDFLRLNIEDEPGCGVLSCPCCILFILSLGTLPGPSHPTWDPPFKSAMSIDLSSVTADVIFFSLGFLSGFPHGSKTNSVPSATATQDQSLNQDHFTTL